MFSRVFRLEADGNDLAARCGSSIPPSHAADDPADAERHECRRVGTRLDGVADIVLRIASAAANRPRGIGGGVFCLTVEVLRRSRRLVEDALDLAVADLTWTGAVPARNPPES